MSYLSIAYEKYIADFFKYVKNDVLAHFETAEKYRLTYEFINQKVRDYELLNDYEASARKYIMFFKAPGAGFTKPFNIKRIQELTNQAGKSIVGNKAVLSEAMAQKNGILSELKRIPEIQAYLAKAGVNDSQFISNFLSVSDKYKKLYKDKCDELKNYSNYVINENLACLGGISLNRFIREKIRAKLNDDLCIGSVSVSRDNYIKDNPGAPFFDKNSLVSKVELPLMLDFKKFSGLISVGYYNDSFLFDNGRNILVNLFKTAILSEKERYQDIYYFDNYMYNADALGEFRFLAEGDESFIRNAPADEKTMESALSNIKTSLSTVRPGPDEKRLFVFNSPLNRLSPASLSVISWLVATAKTNNFTVILLYEKDRRNSDSSNSNMILRDCDVDIFCSSEDDLIISFQNSSEMHFKIYEKQYYSAQFRDWKKEEVKLDNAYKRTALNCDLSSRKIKPIVFGCDSNGNEIKFDINGNKFSTYIVGSAGSGKSNLIHVIISELIQKNHPDLLEIWFVDFGNSAMSVYKKVDEDKCPPHVKNIILDDSPVMMCSVITALHKILKERQLYFSKRDIENVVDFPLNEYIPSILVIFDEFSRMVNQLPNCEEKYTDQLTELFAQGRKYGFKFIIANQEFGIPASGAKKEQIKGQIKNRIGLLIDQKDKLTTAFDLQSVSDRDKYLLESLQKYHVLMKKDESVGGNWLDEGLIFESKDTDRFAIVKDVCDYYSPTAPSKWSGPVDGRYLVKKKRIVDPGAEHNFREYKTAIKAYNKEHPENINIFPGMPKTIEPVVPFVIQNDLNENILIFGGIDKKKSILSIYSAISNSVIMSGGSVDIIAGRNSALAHLVNNSADGKLLLQKISDAYAKYIQAKREGKSAGRFIFISGIEKILERIEIYEEDKEEAWEKPAEAQKPITEQAQSTEGGIFDSQVEEFGYFSTDAKPEPEKKNSQKNASEMLLELVKRGSDNGVHIILISSDAGMFSYSSKLGLKTEMFKHKLIFQASRDNVNSKLGCSLTVAKFVENLAGNCFRYDNGIPTDGLEYMAFSE